MSTGEFELVEWMRARFARIGDDCAVLDPPAGRLLLATDAVVEGVDFPAGTYVAADVGHRAVLVNASDVAAMGGRPLHLLVTIVAPPQADVRGIVDGVERAARAHGCEVVGGDLSATAGPLVVSVAITGVVDDGEPVTRAGARPGDEVYVTGPLGGAAARGYPTDEPRRARIDEGQAARRAGATAMIDVSDGLAADLGHILHESRVGVIVAHVPVADGATEAQALSGGDDYELVFTLPPGTAAPPGAIRIGTIVADTTSRIDAAGWQHRFS